MLLLPMIIGLYLTPPPRPAERAIEREVLVELNRARADPEAYAASLLTYRTYYQGREIVAPGASVRYATQEGVAPLDEAIDFLVASGRRGPMDAAATLAYAAADHRAEQQVDGAVGHYSRDGASPGERVRRRGGDMYVGEVIAYGSATAADVVRQLIIDDGVPDRGHRRLLFDPRLRYAGVSCGPHPGYRYMCVIDMAVTHDGRPDMRMAARRVRRHRFTG